MLTPTTGVTLADYNAAVLAGNATHARLVFPVQDITLTDDNISANGGISLTQILNPDTDLTMGKAVATQVVAQLFNGNVFSGFDWSEEFHLDFGVDIGGDTKWVTVGYYTGKRPDRLKRTETIEFTALDRMTKFDILADDFLDSLTFPATMETIYHSLCTYVGLGYTAGNELADSMAISYSADVFPRGVTCRQLLAWIAEANCCYAKIDSTGNVKLVWFSLQAYSIDEDDYFGIELAENTVTVPDYVRISDSEQSGSGTLYPLTGDELYTILDNPFLLEAAYSEKTAFIDSMLTRFGTVGAYTPTSLNITGNWMVEPGDIMSVGYDNGSIMNMPVFARTLHWTGGGADTYECSGQATRTQVTENAKVKYEEGAKLANKYTVQSGIDITDEGLTVSGGKFVKIVSGGTLDVQSTNFSISSTDKRMKSGRWTFDDKGARYYNGISVDGFEIAEINDMSTIFSGIYYSNDHYSTFDSGEVIINVENVRVSDSVRRKGQFIFYTQYVSENDQYTKFFLPSNGVSDGFRSAIGSLGNPFDSACINGISVRNLVVNSSYTGDSYIGSSSRYFTYGFINGLYANYIHASGEGHHYVKAENTTKNVSVRITVNSNGDSGVYSNGYWDGTQSVEDGKWMVYRDSSGNIKLNGSADYATSAGNADTVDNKHASDFVPITGGVMSGNLEVGKASGNIYLSAANTTTGLYCGLFVLDGQRTQGIYSSGYYDGSSFHSDGKWLIYRNDAGDVLVNGNVAWDNVTGKPSSYTPSSHTHGNIQNGGTLQSSDVTIANGDKLVITDSSDSSKVARASIAFDGSTATKALTQKGTWETFNNYSLPLAASGTRGGVQIGYSENNKKYAVKLDNEKMYVEVPWTDHYAWSDITDKPATATRWPAWSEVTSKPTIPTVDKQTVVMQISRGSDFDPIQSGYFVGMTQQSGIDTNWWHILSMDWSGNDANNWISQLAIPTESRNGIYYRTRQGSSTKAWVKCLDANNYTDYTVKKDGTGASGTWGIGISGNAATATSATSATSAGYITNFKASKYTIAANKGVRIQYPVGAPVYISVQRSNGGGRLLLAGGGYGAEGWVRNDFIALIESQWFEWCLPSSSSISNSIEIKQLQTSGTADVYVWTSGSCTFTEISALSTTANGRQVLNSSNYTSYTVKKDGTGASGTWGINITGNASGNVLKSGDTMTGNLLVQRAGETTVTAKNTNTGISCQLMAEGSGVTHGLWSPGYYTGTNYTINGKWMIVRLSDGTIQVNGNCTGNAATSSATTDSRLSNIMRTIHLVSPGSSSNKVTFTLEDGKSFIGTVASGTVTIFRTGTTLYSNGFTSGFSASLSGNTVTITRSTTTVFVVNGIVIG